MESEIDTSAENIARMRDVLTGSLPVRVQPDGTTLDAAGFNAVIPGLDALEAWVMLEAIAAERDALVQKVAALDAKAYAQQANAINAAAERDAEKEHRRAAQDLGQRHADERDAVRAEAAWLREALEEIERGHVPSMPMTEVVDELVWTQMWVGRLRKIARAALAQKDEGNE
jgi:hypothetical protein